MNVNELNTHEKETIAAIITLGHCLGAATLGESKRLANLLSTHRIVSPEFQETKLLRLYLVGILIGKCEGHLTQSTGKMERHMDARPFAVQDIDGKIHSRHYTITAAQAACSKVSRTGLEAGVVRATGHSEYALPLDTQWTMHAGRDADGNSLMAYES